MPLRYTDQGIDSCIICGRQPGTNGKGIYIARCCCDSDFICEKCTKEKRLMDYLIRTLGDLYAERKE
jgi:hypothetical protein